MKKHFLLLLVALFMSCSALWAQPTLCPGTTHDFSYYSATDTIHYSSTDTSVISINATTGIAHAIAPGYASILYRDNVGTLVYITPYQVLMAAPTIMGDSVLCISGHTTLSTIASGGFWIQYGGAGAASSPWWVADIDSISGVVIPHDTGIVEFCYYVSHDYCQSRFVLTIHSALPPTSDTSLLAYVTNMCVGSGISLSAGYTTAMGGIWSSSNPAVASAYASPGSLYPLGISIGIAAGTATISYTLPITIGGCATTHSMTKNIVVSSPVAVSPISGPATLCLGATITLSDTLAGGVWSTSNPLVATLHSGTVGGPSNFIMVDGLSGGSAIITYTYTGMCGGTTITSSATFPIVVLPPDTPGIISGPTSVTTGAAIVLSNTVAGGVWSVSPATVATIDATTGILSGVGMGTALVTYTVVGTCGFAVVSTYSVTVNPPSIISGSIYLTAGGAYTGDIKVWLIKYVSPLLTAVDSTVVHCSDTMVAYQFSGALTDSYRIKVALVAPPTGTTGYIPTYHSSSFYWNTANVLLHTAGTVDAGQNIVMDYGAATIGPGFIGGDVTTGANKGTSSGVPVSGLMMYVFNATSMQLMQSVRTDATGHYSFSNLQAGETYYIFPDSLNYRTTPFTGISLAWSNPIMTAANFVQHTLSHTITPDATLGVSNIGTKEAYLNVQPNPATGKLNIMWQATTTQAAAIIITDITGRVVYKTNIDMAASAGSHQIDISSLDNGLYTMSIKSSEVNFIDKIQVQL